MDYSILFVPGLHNSGPEHWQTWLEQKTPGAQRVVQDDWRKPNLLQWSAKIESAIHNAEHRVILVAHSFGALASVVAATNAGDRVAGALFVAPADPTRYSLSGEILPAEAYLLDGGLYNAIPKERLMFPSIIAASLNDPCIPFKRAAWWASVWRSKLVTLGNLGHVNEASQLGPWPEGEALLRDVIKNAEQRDALWDQIIRWAF